jgi:hypothetical protein
MTAPPFPLPTADDVRDHIARLEAEAGLLRRLLRLLLQLQLPPTR